jgi:hypothetical protein
MLKGHKVVANMSEFSHLTIGQIRFFMRKNDEYEATAKKQRELNERFKKK